MKSVRGNLNNNRIVEIKGTFRYNIPGTRLIAGRNRIRDIWTRYLSGFKLELAQLYHLCSRPPLQIG